MLNVEVKSPRKIEAKMNINFSSQLLKKKMLERKQLDKDSGVYDSYSSQRGSVCSSGFRSESPDTTSSSAYSSATSTCSEHDHHRQKLGHPTSHVTSRVPFHPKLLGASSACTSHVYVSASTTSQTSSIAQSRNLIGRSTSMKSDRSSADMSRCLCDVSRDRVFEKKRLLGKGGFARVYEVSEIGQWSRPMAAKVIEKSRLIRSSQREKVNTEIELFAEASGHPNIVSYHDTFEDENCVCILQELCGNKSLTQYARRNQPLNEAEVCEIMLQIISGLKHLHGKGIIHRDLKLGNILLTDDFKVKIGDFGMATRIDAEQKKTVCGTPNFIAPEVLQRQGHGFESDIWALGCLLYTLLVGKPPFETACLKDTYRCIVKNNYRIPVTVSSEASDLIQSMLRPKPADRLTLTEIVCHQFFKKHLTLPRSEKFAPFNDQAPETCRRQAKENETDSSSQDETSVTQLGKNAAEKNPTKTTVAEETNGNPAVHACNEAALLPVKSLASLLQKKLAKMSTKKETMKEIVKDQIFKERNQSSKTSSEKISSSETWVTKWVDYSNRYGFGYQLSTGTVCVLFNDGKHISINPCTKIIEYAPSEKATVLRFSNTAVPTCLRKYASVLTSFCNYIGKSFQPCSNEHCDQVKNEARLLAWCRTDKYVAMYFNNGTMQVNFSSDHVKISISSLHKKSAMRFTVVDQYRQSKVYNRNEFLAGAEADLLARMSIVHRQFHGFFDVECDSHPFCEFCWQHGC